MFGVVMLHTLGQGGILWGCEAGTLNYSATWLLEIACFGAVNCFALISGYVGINAKHRYASLATLWLQVVVISLVLRSVQFIIVPESFSMKTLVLSFFPVLNRTYWYFTDYVILFFLMPVLNSAVKLLERRVLRNALISLSVIFCIPCALSLIRNFKDPFQIFNGYSALWLAFLYLVGGYVSRHGTFGGVKRRTCILVYLGATLFVWSLKLLGFAGQLVSYVSPFVFIGSVALLVLFANSPSPNKRAVGFIKLVSPLTFGIYIIHLHGFVWNWLLDRFKAVSQFPLPLTILLAFLSAAGIFAACAVIEWLRAKLFDVLHIKRFLLSLEEKIIKR